MRIVAPIPQWSGQKLKTKQKKLKTEKKSNTEKLKNVQRYAKISNMPFDQRSVIHREAWFPPCFVGQNQQKTILFFKALILDHFPTNMFNSETTSLQHYSPRIPNLKFFLGHLTSGSGGKIGLKF